MPPAVLVSEPVRAASYLPSVYILVEKTNNKQTHIIKFQVIIRSDNKAIKKDNEKRERVKRMARGSKLIKAPFDRDLKEVIVENM